MLMLMGFFTWIGIGMRRVWIRRIRVVWILPWVVVVVVMVLRGIRRRKGSVGRGSMRGDGFKGFTLRAAMLFDG